MKFNWGIGIIIAFIIFMAVTLLSVFVFMNEDVELVTDNYYEKTLEYQKQIDILNRTSNLSIKPDINLVNEFIYVKFPPDWKLDRITGTVSFYRPNNAKKDFVISLKFDTTGVQVFDGSELDNGLWKIKASWQMDSLDYYIEKAIIK